MRRTFLIVITVVSAAAWIAARRKPTVVRAPAPSPTPVSTDIVTQSVTPTPEPTVTVVSGQPFVDIPERF